MFFHPTTLYYNNKNTLYIASNLVFHEKTKYLKIDYHLVQEKTQKDVIWLLLVLSSQLAYMFTKALPPCLFKYDVSKLELIDLHTLQFEGG